MPRLLENEDENDAAWSVDHINRDKNDNRLVNLRWATEFDQNNNRSCCILPDVDSKNHTCPPKTEINTKVNDHYRPDSTVNTKMEVC